jgi:low temperature requirement protein LtrA
MSEPDQDEDVGVSSLELFFDLVFVFTITQLTSVLAHETTLKGALQVVLMLGVIWWMYSGYVWLTNAVRTDGTERRAFLLAGMGAYFILALAIPKAFTDGGPAFGIAYAIVVAIHTALFTRTTNADTLKAVIGLAPFNLATAALVLAGGIAGGTAQYVLWCLAFVCEWITPWVMRGGFTVSAGHFVERHGLVILIAIGESVVAVGVGAADERLDLRLAMIALLGLALSATLWWSYFGDDSKAQRAMEEAKAEDQQNLAALGFGLWHLLMLLGIIGIAAAEKTVVAHPFDALAARQAIVLGSATAVYMAGDALFRSTLQLGESGSRAAAAVLAAVTIPLGLVPAALQLAALTALLAATLATERRGARQLT